MSIITNWDSEDGAYDMPDGGHWDAEPVPEPKPPKKKKPFHRAPKPSNPPPTPSHTMSNTFKFNVSPKSTGGFRTNAVLGTQIDEAALVASIATETDVVPEKVPLVIKALFTHLRSCTHGCNWATALFGELSVRPTCGGSSPSPDGFQNAEEINADIALSFTAEIIQQWRATLQLESQGTKGLVTPVIDTILCLADNAEDHYVVMDNIRLYGHDLRFDKADVLQGVFFIKADGTEVRATVYGPINPSDVTVLVPAGLTGALQVRISAHINGSLRTYLYTRTLS